MLASHWLCLLLSLDLSCATLSKSDRKKKKEEKVLASKEPGPGLTAREVLEKHGKYKANTSEKNFAGEVLGYVTPWNSHGWVRL